jgi:hypothetical protein
MPDGTYIPAIERLWRKPSSLNGWYHYLIAQYSGKQLVIHYVIAETSGISCARTAWTSYPQMANGYLIGLQHRQHKPPLRRRMFLKHGKIEHLLTWKRTTTTTSFSSSSSAEIPPAYDVTTSTTTTTTSTTTGTTTTTSSSSSSSPSSSGISSSSLASRQRQRLLQRSRRPRLSLHRPAGSNSQPL